MFSLLSKKRGLREGSPRQIAKERVQSAIRRDRMEVSALQLTELRDTMLLTIKAHLPVASEFAEFRLQRDGDDVFLVSRVRLEGRR